MLCLYLNGPSGFGSHPALQRFTAQRGMTQDETCSGHHVNSSAHSLIYYVILTSCMHASKVAIYTSSSCHSKYIYSAFLIS